MTTMLSAILKDDRAKVKDLLKADRDLVPVLAAESPLVGQ